MADILETNKKTSLDFPNCTMEGEGRKGDLSQAQKINRKLYVPSTVPLRVNSEKTFGTLLLVGISNKLYRVRIRSCHPY